MRNVVTCAPAVTVPVADPSPGLAFIDGSSEEGDESLYGGCVVGNHLSWAEPTWTGLLGQLGSDKGECLFGHVVR